MSDHIPLEVQMEIMKRFPVISLFQFRSVSKTWKSLIDDSHFIRPQRLLIGYTDPIKPEQKFISVVDDDTFPQHVFATTAPNLFEVLTNLNFVGSSRGLLCFHGECPEPGGSLRKEMAVIWNPCINKSITIHVPVIYDIYSTNLGFGVCPKTSEFVLVNIYDHDIPEQVDVFKLSNGVWRRPLGNLPRKSIHFWWSAASIDGLIYWSAFDKIVIDGQSRTYNLIMSFDMISEDFKEVNLPHDLANRSYLTISMSGESLVVLQHFREAEKPSYGVWMMNHGDLISFTKLFNINTPFGSVLGFKTNGEPITERMIDDCETSVSLEVYEPRSIQTNALGICAGKGSSFVCSYRETPMLLDQMDGSIYAKKLWG